MTAPVLTFRSCETRGATPKVSYPIQGRESTSPLNQPVTYLDINLVSAKNHRDVLTDSLQIPVPVGNVLVGDTRGNIEHEDTTLSLNVVSISKATKLLLSSGIPNVEADGTEVGGELKRVDLHTESS